GQKFRIGNRQAFGIERETDAPLLDDAVDVVPPRVAIEQAINRQAVLFVEAPEQPSHAARRLAGALRQNAIVFLPKPVFVEAAPDRAFFDVEHEIRVNFFELKDVFLDDAGNGVPAGAHPAAVYFVAGVDEGDVA